MAFREGKGDEALLTCKNCQSNFEIDAQFCTECGVTRLVALGVENSDQIESTDSIGSYSESNSFSMPQFSLPRISIKESKLFISITGIPYKIGTQYSKLNILVNEKRKKFLIITGITATMALYIVIQSIIFSTQKPDQFTQRYINAVSNRDVSEISKDSELFPNPENLEILPSTFLKWKEVSEITWNTTASWNGWLGKGNLHLSASTNGLEADSIFGDPNFNVKLKAKFYPVFGIFRGVTWVAADSVPVVENSKVLDANQSITLNRENAGTSSSPTLNSKRYATLPGPFEMILDGEGFTKARTYTEFVTNGSVTKPTFDQIDYEMSSYQSSDAKTKLESQLKSCLKRECSSLPYLGTNSFTFSDEPSSYMYINYFNTSWSDYANCTEFEVSSINASSANVNMNCTATAYAYIRWYLYRLIFTWYYTDGSASDSFNLKVSATAKPSGSGVILSNFRIN